MQAFRNIFRAVSGKRGKAREERSNELTENVLTGLKRVLKHIENQAVLPRDLYKEPGFIEEISAIEALVDSGKISEAYLETVRSTHSIAMAIVNVLSAHDPIIPQSLYDHFMSPMANIDALIDDLILKSPIFDQMMAHLRKVLNDRNVNISSTDIAASVGIHMLRAVEDDAGFDSQTFESQARIRTFEKILTRYIAGKEESERFFASANTANRRSSSLNVPLAITEAPTAARVMQKTPEPSPSAPAAAVLNLGTIQERSVKVIFSDPDSKPSQDELRTLLSRYGVVSNVGYKEKLAVVLFASKAEAQACARDQDGKGLGEDFKIKYLGGALDPAPSPVPAAPAASAPSASVLSDALPSDSPSKIFAYQDGNIKHYTTFPDSKPAVIDVPAEGAAGGAQAGRRPSLEPRKAADEKLNTSVLSASGGNEVTGWANASRSSAHKDTSVLNSSLVSEFSPPNPARKELLNTSGETVMSMAPRAVAAPAQQRHSITESASAAGKVPQQSAAHDNAQNLTVQDLSMLSFTAEPQDLDVSRRSDRRPSVGAAPAAHARAPENRAREHSDSGDHSASEEGDAAEEYPLAPGSADSLQWPTRAVSPPKPGPGVVQAGARGAAMRMDSTGSSNGSWKSAQLTRSPETATHPASGVRTKSVHSEPARGAEDHSGTDTAEESASETEQVHPLPMKRESEETTPRRGYPVREGTFRDRSNSSSDGREDDRYASQLTTGTEGGSRRGSHASFTGTSNAVPRFSTESMPRQSGQGRNSEDSRSARDPWASPGAADTARSTEETAGSLSSSVKKRQIRTIQVGSPLNSTEQMVHRSSAAQDADNFLQEEQTDNLRSRSNSDLDRSERVSQRSYREGPSTIQDGGQYRSHPRGADMAAMDVRDVSTDENRHARRHSEDSRGSRQSKPQQKASSPSRQQFQAQPHFTQTGSPGRTAVTPVPVASAAQPANPEVLRLVDSLQERLKLLEAQMILGNEAENLRRATQAKLEEQWSAEIMALSLRNQQTALENARLQEELERWKLDCVTTQAALRAAEAGKRSLLLSSEGLKDRAQHDALDTVIAQKRLIASLEAHLLECSRQMKTLEGDLGFMRDKHCTTASSLITWKAKAIELSAMQGSGSVASDGSQRPPAPVNSFARTAASTLTAAHTMDAELLQQLTGSPPAAPNTAPSPPVGADPAAAAEEPSRSQFSRQRGFEDISAHFAGVNQSHIPDMNATSRANFDSRNTTFVSEDGGMDRSTSGDSDKQLQVHLEAQRKATARITRQYISTLPVPEKPSAMLLAATESALATKAAIPARTTPKPESTKPHEEVFVPNPLYAALLEKIDAQHPRNVGVGAPMKSLPVPAGPVQLHPHGGDDDVLWRPDLTAALSSSDRRPGPQPDRTAARGTSTSPSRRDRDNRRQLARPTPSTDPTSRFLQGNDKFAALMRGKQPQAPKAALISPLALYQSVPLAEEISIYEKRLNELARSNDGRRGLTRTGGSSLTFTRASGGGGDQTSALSRSYSLGSTLGSGHAQFGSTVSSGGNWGGADRYRGQPGSAHPFARSTGSLGASTLPGRSVVPPTWAQYKYE